MSKKASRGATSTAPSSNSKGQKSSISKSAFAPSHLQLTLFASVIQGIESQHLRIHDINTGRLRCEHAAAGRARITSLAWGYYGTSYRENRSQSSKKKRKRDQDASEHAVVAYGTSGAEICMFSPAQGKLVGKLSGVHEKSIKDFQFYGDDYSQGWSVGGDSKLVQWDLESNKAIRTVSLPDSTISTLAFPTLEAPQILCASSTPYTVALNPSEAPVVSKFDSFKNNIHLLIRSGVDESHPSELFLAADGDRYINVFDITQQRLVNTMIVGGEIQRGDFFSPASGTRLALSEQTLAVVTSDGLVELFARPFFQEALLNGDLKSKRKSLTRKATAKVKLVSPDRSIPIFSASFQGPDLVLATVDGGVDVAFQKVRWQDEGNGELLFDGVKEVKYNQAASTLNTVTMNGARDIGQTAVDESKTVVINGGVRGSSQDIAIEIDSTDDEDDLGEASTEEEEDSEENAAETGTHEESDESEVESEDATRNLVDVPALAEDVEMLDEEVAEPSFGELLARKHPETITMIEDANLASSKPAPINAKQIQVIPTGVSLSTVLTQSLRTNDQNLLESCLHNTDADIIKNTIQRLDSSLAGILLQKLAERLASRPGRYGHLQTWVQHTCIVHGGIIAGRPEVQSKLRTLYDVLSQRAKSLDNLLLLKGKLDMLDAQLTIRRDLQNRRGQKQGKQDANIIYVDEGDNWSSDEDEADTSAVPTKAKRSKRALKEIIEGSDSEENSDEDDEMQAITNGVNRDSEEDSEEEIEEMETDDSEDDEIPIQKSKTKSANKMEAIIDDEADESHASDEELASSDEEEDSDEEADSEMDDFINDNSIDEEPVEDDIVIEGDESGDDLEAPVQKPKKKKARRS